MTQQPTPPYKRYATLSVQIRDNFKPIVALQGIDRLQRRVENDDTVGLEDKIELYKLFDTQRSLLRKQIKVD